MEYWRSPEDPPPHHRTKEQRIGTTDVAFSHTCKCRSIDAANLFTLAKICCNLWFCLRGKKDTTPGLWYPHRQAIKGGNCDGAHSASLCLSSPSTVHRLELSAKEPVRTVPADCQLLLPHHLPGAGLYKLFISPYSQMKRKMCRSVNLDTFISVPIWAIKQLLTWENTVVLYASLDLFEQLVLLQLHVSCTSPCLK